MSSAHTQHTESWIESSKQKAKQKPKPKKYNTIRHVTKSLIQNECTNSLHATEWIYMRKIHEMGLEWMCVCVCVATDDANWMATKYYSISQMDLVFRFSVPFFARCLLVLIAVAVFVFGEMPSNSLYKFHCVQFISQSRCHRYAVHCVHVYVWQSILIRQFYFHLAFSLKTVTTNNTHSLSLFLAETKVLSLFRFDMFEFFFHLFAVGFFIWNLFSPTKRRERTKTDLDKISAALFFYGFAFIGHYLNPGEAQ